jgi:hypothetical protein
MRDVKQVSDYQTTRMPSAKELGLSKADINELVNYLHSLKK